MTTLSNCCRGLALVGLLAHAAIAQATPPAPPAQPRAPRAPQPPDAPARPVPPGLTFTFGGNAARSYLGITPRTGRGAADTLGLLIDDVAEGLPAARAGITAGARLVSIDDMDLRVDAADVGDPMAEALPNSRLRRVLARKEPGDTVTLVVLTDRRKETKRVVLAESPMARSFRMMSEGRRVLGVSFSQRGSMRDTAGLLIIGLTSDGAAAKAGLNEGDRLISIDGIDLRVPAEDAGTPEGVEARISRLRRALDAARDSQPVRLEVLADGRRRTVSVVPTRERGWTFGTAARSDLADLNTTIQASVNLAGQRAALARGRAEMARATGEVQRAMARVQRDGLLLRSGEMDGSWSRDGEEQGRVRGTIRGRTDGATLVMSGLSLALVDRDFAQQFGAGSENGALVVRTRSEWDPIRTGDVILSVDGRSVRDGDTLDISFDRRREQRVEVIRRGKRETLMLQPSR